MKKNKPNSEVDKFLIDGCGRCKYYATPECKVNSWQEELKYLRDILLNSELKEDLKWSFPCYTYQNSNIVLLGAFKDYCSLSFFKGALLKDKKTILEKPGENTQAARLIKFKNLKEIKKLEVEIKNYIKEAIELEKSGVKIDFKEKSELKFPDELQLKFKENSSFKKAFLGLTPGRQRGYILYFSQPKQSKTKMERIEKYIPKILKGMGLYD